MVLMSRDHTSAWRTRTSLLLVIGAAMTLAGCGPAVTRDQVMGAYQRGDYARAYSGAADLAGQSAGAPQQEMSFIAGMSAYHADRAADAIRYLAPLADNADRRVSGTACATLGLIHADRGEYDPALKYFNKAVPRLDGENLAQVHYYLGVTHQKLGQNTDARSELRFAQRLTADPGLREAIRERLATTGYTLQFGAYGEPRNAEERASLMRSIIAGAGLGAPRVVYAPTPKGKLYLVQAGLFPTSDQANRAKDRLGRKDVVVTAIGK